VFLYLNCHSWCLLTILITLNQGCENIGVISLNKNTPIANDNFAKLLYQIKDYELKLWTG
jgi:hypothetical protein